MRTYIRVLFFLAFASLMYACSEKSEKELREEIKTKTSEIEILSKEIEEIEAKLPEKKVKGDTILVNTLQMSPVKFDHHFTVYGEVEALNYAKISPELGGKIEKIHVSQGDFVQTGQLLVSLNNSSIKGSAAQLKSQLEFAKVSYEKQKRLWDQKIGSEIQFLQAKTQVETLESQLASIQSQVRMNEVRAPFDGYVNEIYLKVGELAGGIAPVIDMVDLSKLRIQADISEKYASSLKKRDKVLVQFESIPDWNMLVPIKSISRVISKQSRTFQIELTFSNKNELIKPNMVSKIQVTDYSNDSAFVLSSLIIREDINGKYVFAVEKNKAIKKYVETGLSVGNETMILDGIKQNDQVIIDGFNLVTSGVEVHINSTEYLNDGKE